MILNQFVAASSDSVKLYLIPQISNRPLNQTISATGIFLYHIAKNPHVQRRAQEEIDQVVGNARLPDARPALY